MDMEKDEQKNLIDTTDCLEAVGVFRGWKNFLFVIVILCLLLLQASFWLVNSGYVATGQAGDDKAPAAASVSEPITAAVTEAKEDIKKAAEQVTAPGKPAEAAPQPLQPKPAEPRFRIEFKHLAWLIRFVDFALILAAILYCLTILFSLKVSLLGRLGGINHISRAFFLSLVFLVLLLPWQKFFANVVYGAIYTPSELLISYAAKTKGVFSTTLYYLRFSGHWLVVVLLLVSAHIRSSRWAKAILRRLEVI